MQVEFRGDVGKFGFLLCFRNELDVSGLALKLNTLLPEHTGDLQNVVVTSERELTDSNAVDEDEVAVVVS